MSEIYLLATASEFQPHHPEPGIGLTLLFAGILVAMILALALEEKIHAKKSVIAGGFALICLLLGDFFQLLPIGALVNVFGQSKDLPVYIPAVDWTVIAIIMGSSLFVDVTSRSGLFSWFAIRLTKLSAGDPVHLLWTYGLMTVVFSAVLNNVTAMVIVGSLTVVSLEKLGRRDSLLGFLLIEGLLTNIGGLLTLVSSVPNIIVGQAAGISYVRFFLVSAPYVVLATVLTLVMGAKLFGVRRLRTAEEKAEARELVEGFDENDSVESTGFFWYGAAMMILFILFLATTSFLPYLQDLGLGFVAMFFGVLMLIRFKAVADKFYQALDWDLLAFFIGLFIVIDVMEHAEVLTLIGKGIAMVIDLGPKVGGGALLGAAAVFSSVTDNIPLAAMLARILSSLGTPGDSALWWSVVFGANLGGNITPIGSASTLVCVTLIHKHKLQLSFGGFVVKAIPFALAQIVLAVLYVLLVL